MFLLGRSKTASEIPTKQESAFASIKFRLSSLSNRNESVIVFLQIIAQLLDNSVALSCLLILAWDYNKSRKDKLGRSKPQKNRCCLVTWLKYVPKYPIRTAWLVLQMQAPSFPWPNISKKFKTNKARVNYLADINCAFVRSQHHVFLAQDENATADHTWRIAGSPCDCSTFVWRNLFKSFVQISWILSYEVFRTSTLHEINPSKAQTIPKNQA